MTTCGHLGRPLGTATLNSGSSSRVPGIGGITFDDDTNR